MALQKIVIKVGGETDLDTTIKSLENLGKTDKKNAQQFKKTQDEFVIAANKRKELLEAEQKELEKTKERLKKAFTLEDINAFNAVIKDSEAKIKSLQGPIEKTENHTKNLGNALRNLSSALPGGQLISQFTNLSTSINQTTTATGGVTKGMSLLKVAIASTGVGLLVVALGSLVAYFKSTELGSEKLERALAGIGATVKVIIGRFASLGSGLVELFSGNFSEGAKILAGAFSGIGEEITNSTNAAIKLTGSLQDVEDAERNLSVLNAERKNQVDLLLKQAKDRGKTEAERIALLDKAGKIETSSINDQIKLQAQKVKALKDENDIKIKTGEIDKGNISDELAAAQIQLANLKGNSLELLQTIENRKSALQITAAKKTGKEVSDIIDINLNERIEKEETAADDIVYTRTKAEQELYLSALQGEREQDGLREARVKKEAEAEKQRTENLKQQAAQRAYIEQNSIDIAGKALQSYESIQLANTINSIKREEDKNQAQTDNLISNLEKRKDKGLINEATFEAQKANIQKQAARKEADLKRKQFEAEKKANIIKVIIDTAVAIAKTFAQLGWPAGIAGAAVAGANGALQIATISAQPIPAFKDGKINIQGPGTETSDSIHARISKGESVIKARSTAKYKGELEAINSDKFPDFVFRKYVLPEIIKDSLEDKRSSSMASNIAKSMIYQESFNDSNLVNAIRGNKKVKIENINELQQNFDEKRYSL